MGAGSGSGQGPMGFSTVEMCNLITQTIVGKSKTVKKGPASIDDLLRALNLKK